MTRLNKPPASQGKVIPVTPTYLLLREACAYVGMQRTMFREVSRQAGLTIYAYGKNKIWYKKAELDEMMEGFILKKRTS